jgi:hypothetical protein
LGRYELDYALLGDFNKPDLADLLEALRLAVTPRRNWPEFWAFTGPEIAPIPIDDTIQCWLGALEKPPRDTGHVDFALGRPIESLARRQKRPEMKD